MGSPDKLHLFLEKKYYIKYIYIKKSLFVVFFCSKHSVCSLSTRIHNGLHAITYV